MSVSFPPGLSFVASPCSPDRPFQESRGRGSRPKTEYIGLAGRRARTLSESEPAAVDFPGGGSRPETEFNGFAGRRARTFPEPGPVVADFSGGGSRPETEFNGFAGRRARTLSEAEPVAADFSGGGSRLKTKINGFAGSRARTAPEGISDIGKINRGRCCEKRLNCYNHLNRTYHLGSR